MHAEQEFSDDDVREADAALDRLAEAIDATIDAVEHAVKDPAVRDDVASTGRLLADALRATVDEAGRQLRSVRE